MTNRFKSYLKSQRFVLFLCLPFISNFFSRGKRNIGEHRSMFAADGTYVKELDEGETKVIRFSSHQEVVLALPCQTSTVRFTSSDKLYII